MRPAFLLVVVGGLCVLSAQEPACQDCVEARYWQVDPAYWTTRDPDVRVFPEWRMDSPLRGADLAVAFSGGGTRSAAATTGQLRGLLQNNWLQRVRYVTAVSGGSWAAVPFTYFDGDDLSALLGSFDTDAKAIDAETFRSMPNGLLARQIMRSKLGPACECSRWPT